MHLASALSADPRCGGDAPDQPFVHLAEGIRVAARSGDAFGYQLFILAAAGAYRGRNRLADAVATVTNGRDNLEAAAPGLGAPLTAWLHDVEAELGPDSFAEARAGARRLRAQDMRRLTEDKQ